MREHLYKGKRISDNKWTFGGISYAKDGAVFIVTTAKDNLGYITLMEQVYPETVCEYTGLADKNGNKIFEGDIVKFTDKTFGYSHIGKVCFDKGSFCILYDFYGQKKLHRIGKTDKWQDMGASGTTTYSYEVIGNIHDNKNLLED